MNGRQPFMLRDHEPSGGYLAICRSCSKAYRRGRRWEGDEEWAALVLYRADAGKWWQRHEVTDAHKSIPDVLRARRERRDAQEALLAVIYGPKATP